MSTHLAGVQLIVWLIMRGIFDKLMGTHFAGQNMIFMDASRFVLSHSSFFLLLRKEKKKPAFAGYVSTR